MESLFLGFIAFAGILLYILAPRQKKRQPEKQRRPAPILSEKASDSVSFFFTAGGSEFFPNESCLPILRFWKEEGGTVEVRGWTDDHGTPAGNRKLSRTRALEVKRFLETKIGFSAKKILVSFHGTDPESIGNPNKNRFRRVDCLLVQKQERS